MRLKTKRYTKKELENITNSFTQKIGQGGFGAVFAGTLSDEKETKVAVKKLSESSDQGFKEFLAEVVQESGSKILYSYTIVRSLIK